MEFLIQNETIINLKDNTLTIDGRFYEIPRLQSEQSQQNENFLADKTRIMAINDRRLSLEESIRAQKLKNQELGTIRKIHHNITLTDDVCITSKPYPIPHALLKSTRDEINRLKRLNIIRDSCSSFSSPAFPLQKKNGEIRFVIDYRKLNAKTIPSNFPIPRINEYLQELGGSKIFSQIDLNMGYYQIPISSKDIYKTAFSIDNGHYEFLRMPFGLSNAPRTFQRSMNALFGKLSYVKVYLDDILVHSKTEEEHCEHLETVLNTFKNEGIAINFNKSNFFKKQVTYLGHVISSEEIKADTSRISKSKPQIPTTKKQLQRILGVINWFRPYVKNLSTKIAPLYDKTSKMKFQRKETDNKILDDIWEEIQLQTLLQYPNFNQEFVLETDASEIGIGSILKQKDKCIGMYSYKLKKSELNYSVVEKETLAIVKSVQHFRNIIFNARVVVKTDCANSIFSQPLTSRIQRWKYQLAEYDLILTYHKGKENTVADGLSRLPCIQNPPENLQAYNILDIAHQQNASLEEILKLKDSKIVKYDSYEIFCDKHNIILIPDNESENFLKKIHEKLGHPGKTKLYETFNNYIYIKNINKKLINVTRNCTLCLKNKATPSKYGKIAGGLKSESNFEFIAVDILGPLKTKFFKDEMIQKYFYILVIMDIASRWCEIEFLYNITSKSVILGITNQWIEKHGKPKKLLSDQDRQFISREFKNFLDENEIRHIKTSTYNPTCNSIVERANSNIGAIARISRNKHLEDLRTDILNYMNLTANRTTKMSPYEIVYGFSPFDVTKRINTRTKELQFARTEHSIIIEQEKNNKKRLDFIYKSGDRVYKKNHDPDKLAEKWTGPFLVTKVIDQNVVEIQQKNKITRENIKNLKPDFSRGGDRITETN